MKRYTLLLATLLSMLTPVQSWSEEAKFEVEGMAIPPFFFDCLLTKAICSDEPRELNFTGKSLSKFQNQFEQNEDGTYFKQEIEGSWQRSVDPSKTSTGVIRNVGYSVNMKLDDFYSVLNSDQKTKIKLSEDGVYSYWLIHLTYAPNQPYNDGMVVMIVELFKANKDSDKKSSISLVEKFESTARSIQADYVDRNADGFKEIIINEVWATMGQWSSQEHIHFFGKTDRGRRNMIDSFSYQSSFGYNILSGLSGIFEGNTKMKEKLTAKEELWADWRKQFGMYEEESHEVFFEKGGFPSNKECIVRSNKSITIGYLWDGEVSDKSRYEMVELTEIYSDTTPGEQDCTPDGDGDNWSSITCRTTLLQDGESYKP